MGICERGNAGGRTVEEELKNAINIYLFNRQKTLANDQPGFFPTLGKDGSYRGEGQCSAGSAEAARAAIPVPAAAERSAPLTLRALRARSAAAPARPVCPAGGAPPAPPRPSRLPGGDTSGLLGPGRWVKGIVTLRGAASASGCFSQIEGVRREYLTFQRRFAGILLVASFFFRFSSLYSSLPGPGWLSVSAFV